MQYLNLTHLLALLILSACASAPQTQQLLDEPAPLPPTYQILNFPFIAQTENYCGPASLAMLARYAGVNVELASLGVMTFTPGKKGTLQIDFLGAARRLGFMVVPIYTLKNILIEVSHDHPVVVLENLGSSTNPIWHYAVLHGYDLSKRELIFHSGLDQNYHLDIYQFERVWNKADHWSIVILKAGLLPVTSTDYENLLAASALERTGKNKEANLSYQSIYQQSPTEVGALFGLGNTFTALNDYKAAASAFETASTIAPKNGAIWNNLGEVYLKLHHNKHAARAFRIAKSLNATKSE